MSTDIAERLKSEAVLSFLGPGFRVCVTKDENGQIDVYALTGGLAMPYAIFTSILLSLLYRMEQSSSHRAGLEEQLLGVWAHLDLGKEMIANIMAYKVVPYAERILEGALAALNTIHEGTPEERARAILGEITREYRTALADPAPVVGRLDSMHLAARPDWITIYRRNRLAAQRVPVVSQARPFWRSL